MLKIIHIYI